MLESSRISLDEFGVSLHNGFLPNQQPLRHLSNPYYAPWEEIMTDLPALIQSERIRQKVLSLPVLSTDKLNQEAEWQRAYLILAFLTHAYIWGGAKPEDRLPPPITSPFLQVCDRLELPPCATYAALNLWNFASTTEGEVDLTNPDKLVLVNSLTDTDDERWFLVISVAMEACGARIIPLILNGINAADIDDRDNVVQILNDMTACIDELDRLLERMYERNRPIVFYHQIRPLLAGSKNMAGAGLPNGVFYDVGDGKGDWRQYSGGSNAQSSLIQMFDIALGIEHIASGEVANKEAGHRAFMKEMRNYMPGPHRRFLEYLGKITNIRRYAMSLPASSDVRQAYNTVVMKLGGFRDKHIQIVTRYVINPARQSRMRQNDQSVSGSVQRVNLASATSRSTESVDSISSVSPELSVKSAASSVTSISDSEFSEKPSFTDISKDRIFYGTGGTALIPFLKTTRDETKAAARDVAIEDERRDKASSGLLEGTAELPRTDARLAISGRRFASPPLFSSPAQRHVTTTRHCSFVDLFPLKMADVFKNIFGGAAPSGAAQGDDDFADFAGAPDPSPVPLTASGSAPEASITGGANAPFTKWYRVWERTSPSDFWQEAFVVPFLIFILAFHFWGTRKNRRKAKAWAVAHSPVLQSEFAVVGFSGVAHGASTEGVESELVDPEKSLKEKTAQEFQSYATGRQNVAFLDVSIKLIKRYNPIIFIMDTVLGLFFESFPPPVERVESTLYTFDGKEKDLVPAPAGDVSSIKAPNSTYDGFIWAVVHKNSMRRLRVDRYDASITFTKENPKLPGWATVMTESAEITDLLLTPTLIQAIEEAGDALEYLIISDQPVDRPVKLEETTPKKRIQLSLRLPSGSHESTLALYRYFLRLPDTLVSSAHFRPEVTRKLRNTRDEEIRRLRKLDDEEKAEERKIAAEKIKKDERERVLRGLSAEEQRKYLEREKEKEQRKLLKKSSRRG